MGQNGDLLRPPTLLSLERHDLLLTKLSHQFFFVDGPELQTLEVQNDHKN
jgi:hypothetical protein